MLPRFATFSLALTLLAACAMPAPTANSTPTASPVLTARGQEPGWLLTMGADRFVLMTDNGERRITDALPARQPIPDGYRYAVSSPAHRVQIDVVDALCRDRMTGMPHPATVTIELNGRRLDGCGGEPAKLLQAQEWAVERIGPAAVVAGARPTLRFGTDGRVRGNASCNSYGAAYGLSGEGLRIGPAIATKRACVEAARMQQEAAFLNLLSSTVRFAIQADGALELESQTGQTIIARGP